MIRELHHSFGELNAALSVLQNELLRTKPPHWLPLTPAEQAYSNGLNVLTSLISDLWYQDHEQDGRATRTRHGIVLVDQHLCELIGEVNQCKEAFKVAVKKARAELEPARWLEEYSQLGHAGLRGAMQNSSLARVHLRQCYRHLPLLEHWPKKIGFSWYLSGRSIRKLSVAEAELALLALGEDKPHIQLQLHKLHQLPSQAELAQVQVLAPVVRANVVFANDSPTLKKAMNVPLPLFVPDTGAGLPAFNLIDLTPPDGRNRKARADQKINPEPYLPSIRVHLYR